jgi:DNA uptake protein ComE-like DNA-binding protein
LNGSTDEFQRVEMNMTKKTIAAACILLALAATPAMAQRRPIVPPAGTPAAVRHLNPNTATAAQLSAVPGLNAALAADIVKNRPYKTPSDLHKVVGPKVPAEQQPAVYAGVFLPLNLNTATAAEIALIPGMTPRMVHEFEEYRPYKTMAQFNQEIGKYVDATELARLASYVTVN